MHVTHSKPIYGRWTLGRQGDFGQGVVQSMRCSYYCTLQSALRVYLVCVTPDSNSGLRALSEEIYTLSVVMVTQLS